MYVSKRVAVALLAITAFAGSAAAGASALASKQGQSFRRDHGGNPAVLDSSLAPSMPTDPPLFGVAPGALPWVLEFGRAELHGDGRLDVVIRGLVIPVAPFTGTPGPVTRVSAGLYCNDSQPAAGTSPTAAANSPTVPLSSTGDATIRTTLMLPGTKCLAPALLIHPNGATNLYIAATGFGS
jgi:hypothetical protein